MIHITMQKKQNLTMELSYYFKSSSVEEEEEE